MGMKSIARHAIDSELASEGVEGEGALLTSMLESAETRTQALSMLLSTARGYAGYLSAASPVLDPLREALKTGASAAAALFSLASGSGQVEVDLGQKRVRLPATGPTDATHAGNWRIGWWLAHIASDRRAIDQLAATPIEVLRRSSSRGDECQYLYVEALQAIERRTSDWGTRLQRALDATDPERFKLAAEEFVLEIMVPEMELLLHFSTGDRAAFQESLQFALERHKKYWSMAKRKRDPDGYLALGPLAIASMARKAGFAVEVQSDYLPKPLLEGRCGE
jgi:hypothetical protein